MIQDYMIIYCIVQLLLCISISATLNITLNENQIGEMPAKQSWFLCHVLNDFKGQQTVTPALREYVLRESKIMPDAQNILRFIPLSFEIIGQRLALKCDKKYLGTRLRFHRYIDLKFGEIASNLEFTLDNGIQILIIFPNFYQPIGFIIGEQSCFFINVNIKPIRNKSFMPLFFTQSCYQEYMASRIRCGITVEAAKLHEAILLTYTIKDCEIWIRHPDWDQYHLLAFNPICIDREKINNAVPFSWFIEESEVLMLQGIGIGMKRVHVLPCYKSITDIIPGLFKIKLKRLEDILSTYYIKGFMDPRATMNMRPVHFIACIKHILQNPDHWLHKELSMDPKWQGYLMQDRFHDTMLFPELDLLAQDILIKLILKLS